jgi:hypothetical protein
MHGLLGEEAKHGLANVAAPSAPTAEPSAKASMTSAAAKRTEPTTYSVVSVTATASAARSIELVVMRVSVLHVHSFRSRANAIYRKLTRTIARAVPTCKPGGIRAPSRLRAFGRWGAKRPRVARSVSADRSGTIDALPGEEDA